MWESYFATHSAEISKAKRNFTGVVCSSDISNVVTYFQAMAKPQAGSMNRLEYTAKEPATGNTTANSPSAWTVQKSMTPIKP